MRFVPAKELVVDAQKRRYAVPALNTNGGSYDVTRAALEAAQELRCPLILQVYEPNVVYRGIEYFFKLSELLCDQLHITVPVALQIDHGKSIDSVRRAMQAGLTSIMFDASHCPLEENIKKTREVVELAGQKGVSVEAEVGYVKGNEPPEQKMTGCTKIPDTPAIPPSKTDIDEAMRFVREVKVDMLAVAVGTTHGVYKRQDQIDFELVTELRDAVNVPLVMHGTSGISLDDLAKLSRSGMAKINFGEPFRYHYIQYFNELVDTMEHFWHPWKIMQEIKNRLKKDMKELITALGARDKAWFLKGI